jgi:hypothetical protein
MEREAEDRAGHGAPLDRHDKMQRVKRLIVLKLTHKFGSPAFEKRLAFGMALILVVNMMWPGLF